MPANDRKHLRHQSTVPNPSLSGAFTNVAINPDFGAQRSARVRVRGRILMCNQSFCNLVVLVYLSLVTSMTIMPSKTRIARLSRRNRTAAITDNE